MKTLFYTVLIFITLQATCTAQCGINSEELLSKNCSGILLKQMEMNNFSNNKSTLLLKKGNQYSIYLLNPNVLLPKLNIEGKGVNSISNIKEKSNKTENFSTFSFNVNDDGEYKLSLDFKTNERACALMAIYLQNKSNNVKGIYKAFDELKYNNPSLPLKYGYTLHEQKLGQVKIPYARLTISKSEGKDIGKVYGFCDGINTYINRNNPTLGSKTGFVKLERYKDYGYYQQIIYINYAPSVQEQIVDLNTGEWYALNRYTIRMIIANNKELLEAFDKEPKKNKALKDYLIKYSEQ